MGPPTGQPLDSARSRPKTTRSGKALRTGFAPPSKRLPASAGTAEIRPAAKRQFGVRGVNSRNIAVFSRRKGAKPSRAKKEVWLVTANNSLTPLSRAL